MKSKIISLFLLFALLFVPTQSAYAQSPGGDVVLVGDNYTLKSGETVNGNLVVIGGNVTVEENSKVTGDVVVIGGNLKLGGNASGTVVIIGGNAVSSAKVSGDMVAIGGQIDLKKTASVSGSVFTLGGQLSREEGAQIEGDVVNNATPLNAPEVPIIPVAPSAPGAPTVTYENPAWKIAGQFGKAIIIAAVAMLLTLFLQPQMERVSDAIVKQPFVSGSFGLLTLVVTPIAIVLMAVTIILIPVAAIVALVVMPAIWFFGIVSLGQEIGERFAKAINQVWSPVFTTGAGTFLIVFLLGALSSVSPVECVGGLLSFLVSLVVMGGVIKAWLDSRNTPKPSAPIMAVDVPPAS